LINFASYEQIDNCPKKGHKKIPPNLKTNSEGNLGYNKITHPNIVFLFGEFVLSNTKQMLMYGKVSQENYVELTAASAIPNKEIKSPQILRY